MCPTVEIPKRGPRTLSVLVLMALLCACASEEQVNEARRQDLAMVQQTCSARGLAAGTPEFARCADREQGLVAIQRHDLEASEQVPATRIEPGSGQLCLPTAAGIRLTC